jgi:hypothetical protein
VPAGTRLYQVPFGVSNSNGEIVFAASRVFFYYFVLSIRDCYVILPLAVGMPPLFLFACSRERSDTPAFVLEQAYKLLSLLLPCCR